MAAAREILAWVLQLELFLLNLDGIFAFKREQIMAPQAYMSEKNVLPYS